MSAGSVLRALFPRKQDTKCYRLVEKTPNWSMVRLIQELAKKHL